MNFNLRVAVLAVIVALVAVVGGLGLAASDAQAPELPVILTDGFALAFSPSAQAAAAPGDDEPLPAVCKAGVSFDCTYY